MLGEAEACAGPVRIRFGKLLVKQPCRVAGPLESHFWDRVTPLRPVMVALEALEGSCMCSTGER